MKTLFAPLLLILLAFTTVAEDWTTVTLLDKVTVSLPGRAKEDKSRGIPSQMVNLEDGGEVNAFTIDLAPFGLTEETLQQMAPTDEFKQILTSQAITQTGMKLLSNETIMYKDKYVGYDIIAEVIENGNKSIVHNRIIFYKTFGINLNYRPGKKGADSILKNKLFNSLTIAE